MSSNAINDFWRNKYFRESGKSWNDFYKRNKTNFFKDRHWTIREFPELASTEPFHLLEVGCGVGNFAVPLVEENPAASVSCCDISPYAINLIKEASSAKSYASRLFPFVADLTEEGVLKSHFSHEKVDIISLVFVLSAVEPAKQRTVLCNLASVLANSSPDRKGLVLFRDYSVQDAAQLRFKADRRIQDNLFVRQDGTLSYFFTEEELVQLFDECGFKKIECKTVFRRTVNVKEDIDTERRFIQGKWQLKTWDI